MHVNTLDHIVLGVADVAESCAFYARVLGMEPVELAPGRWALRFGAQMISLHPADALPAIARRTAPGTGNFCVLTDVPMAEVAAHLDACGVAAVAGPDERIGAPGALHSIYFNDPDGNLVEVSNVMAA